MILYVFSASWGSMIKSSIIKIIHHSSKSIVHYLNNQYLYKMIYIMDGRIKISFDDRSYDVGPNSFVLLSTFEKHSIQILKKPYVRYFIAVSPKEFDLLVKDPQILSIFKNPITINNVFDVTDIAPTLANSLSEILFENNIADEYSEQLIKDLMYKIIINIFRNYVSRFPKAMSHNQAQIYEVQKYIDQHFTEKLMIDDIAKNFYMSNSWLTHSFKNQTGYSPKEYITLSRLSYAKDLLYSSDNTINQIAYLSGFSDVNNFIKSFKKQYSITPKKMQMQQHEASGY